MLKLSVIFIGALILPLVAWMSVPALICLGALCAVALPVGVVIHVYKSLTAANSPASRPLPKLAVINGGNVPVVVSDDGSLRAA